MAGFCGEDHLGGDSVSWGAASLQHTRAHDSFAVLEGVTWWIRYHQAGRLVRRSLGTRSKEVAEELRLKSGWGLRQGACDRSTARPLGARIGTGLSRMGEWKGPKGQRVLSSLKQERYQPIGASRMHLSKTIPHPNPASKSRVQPVAAERAHRRQVLRSITGLVSVVITGVVGFRLIEGWSLGRSLYFTLITITTVGYGDEGISAEGRIFAVLLLLSGIGIASYTLALVVQSAVADPFTLRKRMQRRIDKMNRHVVLCGFGRMGTAIADDLHREGIAFAVIDLDADNYQRAMDAGYAAMNGDAGCDELLRAVGVERAQTLVAGTSSEAVNILIALSARSLNQELKIIARAEDDEGVRKLRLAGADRVVTPHKSGGQEVAQEIAHPGIASFFASAKTKNGAVALADLVVEAGADLDGQALGEYGRVEGTALAFVALERGEEPLRVPPGGKECLQAGDRLILAGDPKQVARMRKRAEFKTKAA
ncbi:MAG: voltage-gated potassium channel [Gammaproteobacteria bacterium]